MYPCNHVKLLKAGASPSSDYRKSKQHIAYMQSHELKHAESCGESAHHSPKCSMCTDGLYADKWHEHFLLPAVYSLAHDKMAQ